MVEMTKVKKPQNKNKVLQAKGQIKYKTWDKICKLFYSKREARELK